MNGDIVRRRREIERQIPDYVAFVAERIARLCVLKLGYSHDITRLGIIDVDLLFSSKEEEFTYSLRLAGSFIIYVGARLQFACDDFHY